VKRPPRGREASPALVPKGGKVIQQVPAQGLKRLTLVGYASLSGAVLDYLIRNRVETVFMTPTGRYRARLVLDEHRHVALRKAQYGRLADPLFGLKTACVIVRSKLRNMAAFLGLRARQYQEKALRIALEGLGTRVYFEVFPLLIRNDRFVFKGRNRRPPRDPVNAMLSFVYTLLTNEVLSAVTACGLDPYLGSLHEVSYGRPSLACDLVEEYRSFLGDRLVLGLINRKAVSPDDFVYRGGAPANFVDEEEMKIKRPVEMKPSINRAFVSSYEGVMQRKVSYGTVRKKTTYRMLIHHQVRAFANHLLDPSDPYRPFEWEV